MRGFSQIPRRLNPGGGFIAVGRMYDKQPDKEEYILSLMKIVRQGSDRRRADVVVMSGPAYEHSPHTPGRLVRDSKAKSVIWMRWD